MLATFSASTFYICSQRELNKSRWDSVKYLPAVLGLGIGIAINNTRAMLHGFFGKTGEFVRTPKYGVLENASTDPGEPGRAYSVKCDFQLQSWIELAFGLYLSACVVACVMLGHLTLGIPFLVLFAAGYLYVSLSTLLGSSRERGLTDLAVAD